MPNPYFQFKQFTVYHDRSAMKVTTDACLFGAWVASDLQSRMAENKKLLDIGTGTGLLSLMVAQKNHVQIDAVEIDPEAAQQAAENIAASPWKERIQVRHENILQTTITGKYDVVISNPPFYENELRSSHQKKNLAHHSSELRLDQLLHLVRKLLQPNGIFYLLLPYKRYEETERLMKEHGCSAIKKIIVSPSLSHQPFRVMIAGSFSKNETEVSQIAIRNEKQEYTEAFTSLLKDYYLYL